MFIDMPGLTHQQQQQAVERIQKLMADGISSGEAIALVAKELRDSTDSQQINIIIDEE